MRLLLLPAFLMPLSAAAFELQLPLQCELGKTCFIQQYVDHDPGPGARDYRCGTLTNDRHNGTDFRLRSLKDMRAGVAVLAAAPGRVLRVRSNVPDRKYARDNPGSVQGVECGNGIVIAHSEGYETQYCHLAQNSVAVQPGEDVKAGQKIGEVGLSGMTEFPHVHLSVSRHGQVIDPFAVGTAGCEGGPSLWAPNIPGLSYVSGQVLNWGFATSSVAMDDIEAGKSATETLDPDSPALVAYIRTIGLRQGDVERLTLRGPDGNEIASHERRLEKDKAESMVFAGRKRRTQRWERGLYTASYTVYRADTEALSKTFSIEIK